MKPGPTWARAPAIGVVLASAIIAAAVDGHAAPAPMQVALIAPAGSRLADELKRELEISAFEVLLVPPPAGAGTGAAAAAAAVDWKDRARALVTDGLPHAVAIRADGRQMLVLSRASSLGGVQTSFDLQLDPDDRPTRRRACLAVVEYLRVLAENEARAATAASDPAAARAAPIPAAVVAVDSDDAGGGASAPTPPARHLRPWTMGVATAADISSTGGAPAAHLQFMWCFPLSVPLSVRVRVEWPVLGTDFQASGVDVRVWTFGASVDLQYAFTAPTARWRPFVGAGVGNRLALTESSSANPLQSRTAVTPSVNLSLEGGLSYALASGFQIFAEVEVAHDWLVASANRMDYEKTAANATSVHPSIGVLFEY